MTERKDLPPEVMRLCEEVYERGMWATVPNYTILYFPGAIHSRGKIKIGVSSIPPEDAIIVYEHGGTIPRKVFLQACEKQLARIMDAPDGAKIPPLKILKN